MQKPEKKIASAAVESTHAKALIRDIDIQVLLLLPPLIEALQRAGFDPAKVFNVMIKKAAERANRRQHGDEVNRL